MCENMANLKFGSRKIKIMIIVISITRSERARLRVRVNLRIEAVAEANKCENVYLTQVAKNDFAFATAFLWH
jgi:hypothetical protein